MSSPSITLQVTGGAQLRRVRRLASPGKILVKVGQRVQPNDIIATYEIPGRTHYWNIAAVLDVPPADVSRYLRVQLGQALPKDVIVAQTPGLWGRFGRHATMPVSGTLESFSSLSGQMVIRHPSEKKSLTAFLTGEVVDIVAEREVTIEGTVGWIQGAYGIGHESQGPLLVLEGGRNTAIDATHIHPDHQDKILVGGATISAAGLWRAYEAGVLGLISGGIDYLELEMFLQRMAQHPSGLARSFALVITEGFGAQPIAESAYQLLTNQQGAWVSINGETQIRAGAIRPEIVFAAGSHVHKSAPTLQCGSTVRCLRTPYFGQIGTVTELPDRPQKIETETSLHVAKITLLNNNTVVVPRVNLEVIA